MASLRAVRDSEQFRGLVASVRVQAGQILPEGGPLVPMGTGRPIAVQEVPVRVMGAIRSVLPLDEMVDRFFKMRDM